MGKRPHLKILAIIDRYKGRRGEKRRGREKRGGGGRGRAKRRRERER